MCIMGSNRGDVYNYGNKAPRKYPCIFIDYLWKEIKILMTVVASEDRIKEAVEQKSKRRINTYCRPVCTF